MHFSVSISFAKNIVYHLRLLAIKLLFNIMLNKDIGSILSHEKVCYSVWKLNFLISCLVINFVEWIFLIHLKLRRKEKEIHWEKWGYFYSINDVPISILKSRKQDIFKADSSELLWLHRTFEDFFHELFWSP